jgi:hypothetical protein
VVSAETGRGYLCMADNATAAQQLRWYHNAGAVASLEPAIAGEVAEHREIAFGVACIVPLSVRLGLKLVDAVFGMRKNCQGNRLAMSDQRLDPACGRLAGRFKIVLTQDP